MSFEISPSWKIFLQVFKLFLVVQCYLSKFLSLACFEITDYSLPKGAKLRAALANLSLLASKIHLFGNLVYVIHKFSVTSNSSKWLDFSIFLFKTHMRKIHNDLQVVTKRKMLLRNKNIIREGFGLRGGCRCWTREGNKSNWIYMMPGNILVYLLKT